MTDRKMESDPVVEAVLRLSETSTLSAAEVEFYADAISDFIRSLADATLKARERLALDATTIKAWAKGNDRLQRRVKELEDKA